MILGTESREPIDWLIDLSRLVYFALTKPIVARLKELYYRYRNLYSERPGISSTQVNRTVTVSLTTIPKRLETTYICIETLFDQSVKADRVVLWLNPPKIELPESLYRLQRRGLTIAWTEDLGPFTKLIPALKAFPEDLVVTADDDTLYPRKWLQRLLEGHRRHPDAVICHRGKLMARDAHGRLKSYTQWPEFRSTEPSHELFPTGKDGVLYPPRSLHPDVLSAQLFRDLCPTADDIWFKFMALLQGTTCVKLRKRHENLPLIHGTNRFTLHSRNVGEGLNDVYLQAVLEHYRLH